MLYCILLFKSKASEKLHLVKRDQPMVKNTQTTTGLYSPFFFPLAILSLFHHILFFGFPISFGNIPHQAFYPFSPFALPCTLSHVCSFRSSHLAIRVKVCEQNGYLYISKCHISLYQKQIRMDKTCEQRSSNPLIHFEQCRLNSQESFWFDCVDPTTDFL